MGRAHPSRFRILLTGAQGALSCPSFTRVWSVIQFTSQVLPPSSENDCSKWGEFVVRLVLDKSNQDGLAIDRVLGEELTASILEFADLRRVQDANFLVGPIQPPLVRLRIVETQSQTFDMAGWAIDLSVLSCEPSHTLRQTPVPSNSAQVLEPVRGCRRRLR